MLNSLLSGLLSVRGPEAYLIPAALCFGEAAIFLGFVIPGEVAVVYGGALCSVAGVSLPIMLVVVVAAAVLGDTTGYFVGRFFGEALLSRRPLKGRESVARTRSFLRRRGGPAVLLGRFVSVFRALMPGLAGASQLDFPTFILYNAIGGVAWGVLYTLLGYAAGRSYEKALSEIGHATTGVLIGVVVLGAGVVCVIHLRRRRAAGRLAEKAD